LSRRKTDDASQGIATIEMSRRSLCSRSVAGGPLKGRAASPGPGFHRQAGRRSMRWRLVSKEPPWGSSGTTEVYPVTRNRLRVTGRAGWELTAASTSLRRRLTFVCSPEEPGSSGRRRSGPCRDRAKERAGEAGWPTPGL
jgi:hypothetical protein